LERGTRTGERSNRNLAYEFREVRTGLGASQQHVAQAAHLSRARYTRIEGAKVSTLSIIEASRIASVLGLDLVVRVYPGAAPLRDSAHAIRLRRLFDHLAAPLTFRLEVPLPASPERFEQRAWDAVVFGSGERTAVELEMRIRDGQALERRLALKRRDDPPDRFLLAVADTRANHRLFRDDPDLFPDLPRLRTSLVLRALEKGEHPPNGAVFV